MEFTHRYASSYVHIMQSYFTTRNLIYSCSNSNALFIAGYNCKKCDSSFNLPNILDMNLAIK